MLLLLLLFSASLTLSRKARSVPRRPSFYLHYRFSSHFQTNCYTHVHLIVSHHLHLHTWFSSRLPYYSEHTIRTCHPSQDKNFRTVLDTASPHPPIPSHMHHLVHSQFPSILPPKHLSDPPLSSHLHYYCLSLASLLSL